MDPPVVIGRHVADHDPDLYEQSILGCGRADATSQGGPALPLAQFALPETRARHAERSGRGAHREPPPSRSPRHESKRKERFSGAATSSAPRNIPGSVIFFPRGVAEAPEPGPRGHCPQTPPTLACPYRRPSAPSEPPACASGRVGWTRSVPARQGAHRQTRPVRSTIFASFSAVDRRRRRCGRSGSRTADCDQS